jgi:hypothetical protein
MANRRCAYTQAEIRDAETGLNMVALVDEDEAGYWATTYVGDLEYCEGVAKSINEAFGLTQEDVSAIVASSFAASMRS